MTSDPCTDLAGNTASGVPSADFQIDKTNPVVAICLPRHRLRHGGVVRQRSTRRRPSRLATAGIEKVNVNGGPNAAYTAPELDGLHLLACGTNTISSGRRHGDLRRSDERPASDHRHAGLSAATLQYYQPIDQTVGSATPVINQGKMGRVIPVKVTGTLSLGGTPVAMTESFLNANNLTLRIGVTSSTCAGSATSDLVEAYADAGLRQRQHQPLPLVHIPVDLQP